MVIVTFYELDKSGRQKEMGKITYSGGRLAIPDNLARLGKALLNRVDTASNAQVVTALKRAPQVFDGGYLRASVQAGRVLTRTKHLAGQHDQQSHAGGGGESPMLALYTNGRDAVRREWEKRRNEIVNEQEKAGRPISTNRAGDMAAARMVREGRLEMDALEMALNTRRGGSPSADQMDLYDLIEIDMDGFRLAEWLADISGNRALISSEFDIEMGTE